MSLCMQEQGQIPGSLGDFAPWKKYSKSPLTRKSTMILKFSRLHVDFSPQIRLEGKDELPRLHAYRTVIV
jgi:hypothetical protein